MKYTKFKDIPQFTRGRNFMYDRNEIKEIIDEIVFLKKYALFDKSGYDEEAKVIEELKSDLYNAFGIDE